MGKDRRANPSACVKKADRFGWRFFGRQRPPRLDAGDAAVGERQAAGQNFEEAFVKMHLAQAGGAQQGGGADGQDARFGGGFNRGRAGAAAGGEKGWARMYALP